MLVYMRRRSRSFAVLPLSFDRRSTRLDRPEKARLVAVVDASVVWFVEIAGPLLVETLRVIDFPPRRNQAAPKAYRQLPMNSRDRFQPNPKGFFLISFFDTYLP